MHSLSFRVTSLGVLSGMLSSPSKARHVMQGILRGLDQMTNLILAECQERVFSSKVKLCQPKC